MMIKCFGREFEFTNPIISIGELSFDVRKAEEWEKNKILSHEGELARLYLDILPWSEMSVIENDGSTTIHPAKNGIDLSTATFEQIWEKLNTPDFPMSESIKELMRKTMKIKNPVKFQQEINLVTEPFKNEYTLINSEVQTITTLGSCGGGRLGKVRLDGSTDRRE